MDKINYQNLLDETIKQNTQKNIKPKLLLHICCGPCSTYCLEYLAGFFDITLLFYNPNIYPESEFEKRREAAISYYKTRYGDKYNILIPEYNSEEYYSKIKGFEKEKEGGKRCEKCIETRLEYTAQIAKKFDYEYFTTTLTISPYKNSQFINETGKQLSQKYNVKYLFSDFKKNDGYKKSIEICKTFGVYRQDYCGCEFSLEESIKYKKENSIK